MCGYNYNVNNYQSSLVVPQSVQDYGALTDCDTRRSRATEKVSQSMSNWRGDDTMAGPGLLADRLSGLESASEEEGGPGSCGSGSGNNSPTLGTSFFGKHPELGNERIKKVKTKYLTFIHPWHSYLAFLIVPDIILINLLYYIPGGG